MSTPTNPNEAEDAERRLLENELLSVVSQLPFLERGKTLASSMYPELTDFILADRQAQRRKWVEEVEGRAPTNWNRDNDSYESGFNSACAAWRAALRGKQQ